MIRRHVEILCMAAVFSLAAEAGARAAEAPPAAPTAQAADGCSVPSGTATAQPQTANPAPKPLTPAEQLEQARRATEAGPQAPATPFPQQGAASPGGCGSQ